ncbi:MAG: hypothetical protein JNL08_00945 [Planctomycetes bacterium]|nr:hypothetical protein [Planctomycetota bacterium]
MDQWGTLHSALERDDIRRRIWLTSWFINSLARRPDILEELWRGSAAVDAVGWRWCEYRFSERTTFPRVFDALYGDFLHRLPTAPVFVLQAECLYCGLPGFFVSQCVRREDREARGLPSGRCAECRRSPARSRAQP